MDGGGLATIPLFAGMTKEERDRITEVCSDLEVEAGETLVTEGDFGLRLERQAPDVGAALRATIARCLEPR